MIVLVKDITLKHIEFIQKWYYEYKPEVDILFRPHLFPQTFQKLY